MIRSLRAVLYEDERDGVVRAYHPSFLDFLANKIERKGSDDLLRVHKLLFESGISVMLECLKFNICHLEDASLINEEVLDLPERISQFVSAELDYSCQYWFAHLEKSGIRAADSEEIAFQLICTPRALFWLEVLSVTGTVERCLPILRKCRDFFTVCVCHC